MHEERGLATDHLNQWKIHVHITCLMICYTNCVSFVSNSICIRLHNRTSAVNLLPRNGCWKTHWRAVKSRPTTVQTGTDVRWRQRDWTDHKKNQFQTVRKRWARMCSEHSAPSRNPNYTHGTSFSVVNIALLPRWRVFQCEMFLFERNEVLRNGTLCAQFERRVI